jgi:uncharacterized membrane protein YuzA (DUF378 family)
MKKLAWILVIVGALNWGLVGLGVIFGGGNWNVVNLIFGGVPVLEAIIYLLVGISAVVSIFGCKGCSNCKSHGNAGSSHDMGQGNQQM